MSHVYSSFVSNSQTIRKRSVTDVLGFGPAFANDDGWASNNAMETDEGMGPPPEVNEFPLKACDGEPWGTHFHAWLGRSKKRYIFSVFPLKAQHPLGGLPEFSQAIALAVAYDQSGRRVCRSLFPFSWAGGFYAGSRQPVEAALNGGAREWHVHLLARSVSERRAILDDLLHITKHCAESVAVPESEDRRQSARCR